MIPNAAQNNTRSTEIENNTTRILGPQPSRPGVSDYTNQRDPAPSKRLRVLTTTTSGKEPTSTGILGQKRKQSFQGTSQPKRPVTHHEQKHALNPNISGASRMDKVDATAVPLPRLKSRTSTKLLGNEDRAPYINSTHPDLKGKTKDLTNILEPLINANALSQRLVLGKSTSELLAGLEGQPIPGWLQAGDRPVFLDSTGTINRSSSPSQEPLSHELRDANFSDLERPNENERVSMNQGSSSPVNQSSASSIIGSYHIMRSPKLPGYDNQDDWRAYPADITIEEASEPQESVGDEGSNDWEEWINYDS